MNTLYLNSIKEINKTYADVAAAEKIILSVNGSVETKPPH